MSASEDGAPPTARASSVVAVAPPPARQVLRPIPPGDLRARRGLVHRPTKPRRGARFATPIAALISAMIVLFLIGAGGYLASRQLYFIGTDAQGIVTIYRGFPYNLPLGINLYETYYVSGVPASLIPPARRGELLNNNLHSQSDATSLVMDLEQGRISP